MRGKQAQASANRQDRQALVDAAAQAKARADRAERDLATKSAAFTAQIDSANTELRELRRMVTEGTSGTVQRQTAQLEERRQRIEQLESDVREAHEIRLKAQDRLVYVLAARVDVGLVEAGELVMGAVSAVAPASWDAGVLGFGRRGAVVDTAHTHRRLSPQGLAVDRARGRRRTSADFGQVVDVWIVHRGSETPRVLVAMYGNKEAAKAHAATAADLNFEGWIAQGDYNAESA